MTNNLEDFEQPDLEPGGELPPATGIKANLSHAWRTRPLFKLMVLMIVVGAIIAVSINLFSSKQLGQQSRLPAPPTGLKQPPGGPASPYFNEQTMKAEQERERNALASGGSALPTPIGENKSIDEMTDADKQKKDPLIELRNQIEHQKQEIAQMKQQQQAPAAAAQKQEQFDDSLAQAMQKELQKLEGEWQPVPIKQVAVLKDDDQGKKGGANADADAAARAAAANQQPQQQVKVIVPAGTVSYAQLLTEANSDVPGPILAQIVSGPLSGARAIGEFKVSDDYLVLKFGLANLKGKDYGIEALALDPDTTLGGMATEVDQRYFTRVLLPAAAGFIQGFGSALGQGSSSVVSNGETTIVQQSGKGLQQGLFQGLAQVGQTAGQFFENQANQTRPLVRVAAGTPMGLFFLSSVVDRDNGGSLYPPGAMQGYPGAGGGSGYGGYNGYSGYGSYGQMPGMSTVGGFGNQFSNNNSSYGTPNSGNSFPASNVPYPNLSMPYNGNALTNPTNNVLPSYNYNGGNYINTTPTYGLGTPLVNP